MEPISYITASIGTISNTFIRKEIIYLRKLGMEILLFGIRKSGEMGVDDSGLADETIYLYPLNILAIITANIQFCLSRPSAYFKTLIRALFNEETNILNHIKVIYHFFTSSYFAAIIKNKKIAHIHAHFPNSAATVAMYAASLSGITYSVTLHSAGTHKVRSMAALRQKVSYAKFLICISEYTMNYYDNLFNCKSKTFIVHCGIDLDIYEKNRKQSVFRSGQKLQLICIGRFEEKKGFGYAIEACRQLAEEAVDFELVMIGSGSLSEPLKKMADLYGLGQKIKFMGSCSGNVVAHQLANSDICLVPSVKADSGEEEGIPVVIMEAMAVGVFVIATRHSGIPEIVRDNDTGLLVPERDPNAIVKAIKLFNEDDTLRNRCIENGRLLVREEFDIKKNAMAKKKIFERHI